MSELLRWETSSQCLFVQKKSDLHVCEGGSCSACLDEEVASLVQVTEVGVAGPVPPGYFAALSFLPELTVEGGPRLGPGLCMIPLAFPALDN
jgi:hypothetical protein